MMASIPDTLSMTDVDWLRRSNWPTGRDQSDTEQLSNRRTLSHTAHQLKQ
jgi:hypothetical protein